MPLAREAPVGGEPADVVADEGTADLDAAVVAIGGLVGGEGARRRGVEIEPHLLGQRRPVVLQREKIIGLLVADLLGDLGLAADGVVGDERAGELEPLEQERDRHDLVRLFRDRLLAEHQALPARPGRDQMQGIAALGLGPPRGLAVDRHDVGRALAQALDPGGEALGEERRRQRVHHVVQRVVRGDATFVGQEPAQELQLAPAPARDLHEVLRPGKRRAEHEQQDLGQRIEHLPRPVADPRAPKNGR